MRVIQILAIGAALTAVLMAVLPALAQTSRAASSNSRPRSPPRPSPTSRSPSRRPPPLADAGFEELRKQIAAAAQKKDRAALARLVVSKGFFWERETGEGADKKKSGVDNLATALGLANKDAVGWDMLAGYSEDPTASPAPGRANALCAPADPAFDGKAFEALLKATQTDFGEWGYPASPSTDVHAQGRPTRR